MQGVEVGQVADDVAFHAVRTTDHGDAALCGAGSITVPVWGTFDPAMAGACMACVVRLLDDDGG
jgi:hypothetical protein